MTLLPSTTSLHETKDAELVASSRNGDARAFARLVNRYLPMVYNTLYRMTQNHELSEEMAQEAFVKAYSHLDSFDLERGSFKPWILRIATNAAVSELRKQSKVISLNALEESGNWGESEHQVGETMESILERRLSSEEVMQALQKLDAKYRQALILRYQNDLSYEEVAQAMNIPLNTVRTWIKRGLEKLKNEVKEMAL